MTDAATGQGECPTESEWDDEDLPVAEVKKLFTTLGKAFRAYQLYDENNPVRQRFVDSLRGDLSTLWESTDRLVLKVTEDHFMLGETSVYHTENRNDSLAFLFFKDSIREVTFLPGVEGEEVVTFLGVLQKARNLKPEGDDLLTVLWEVDLQFFAYQFVDLLAEGVSLPEAGPGNSPSDLKAVLAAAAEDEERAAEAGDAGAPEEQGPQTVSKDDFNPTMYALDPKEMEILGAELKKEMERDLMGDVLAALLDRLEEPENRQRQSEILEILKALLPSFLSRGRITAATQVFRELRALEELEGGFDEQRLAECREIVEEVSTPEVVSELIQALFDGTIKASSAQFGAFLQFLGGGALAPLLRSSKTVDHKKLRTVLRDAVQRIAEANPDAVVKLLEDEDEDAVVAGAAVRFASEMQIVEAGPALVGLFTHLDSTVRLAAIEAAISLKAPTAANALQQMLADPAVDIRIAAARGIGRLAHRPAAGALAEIVQGKEIRNADVSEKVAFFEAFGMLADDEGVAILDRLLNSKRFLGKREPSAIRAVAALGLGALFHDIGKQRVDYDVINKAGGLTDDEWAQLKEHTTEGLLPLFGMHGFADTPYRQMLMAYEHHMKIDLTGYPSNTRPRQPTLFSRIVAVADAFDAGTSVRSYQYEPWSPDAVLKEMCDNPKRGQDVLLVKALITATGVYPVGTLVILDTRELGVVAQVNPDLSLLHRPTIRLISDPQGRPLARPLTVNLSKSDPATGQVRKIIKTTDPQRYGIRVSDYLLA